MMFVIRPSRTARVQEPEDNFGGVHIMSARLRALFIRAVFAMAAFVVTAMTAAYTHAQDLDQNKPGARLFAESCVTCHKSPRGLAKGRMSFTLAQYLRQHYTSSAASAQTLTAYLQSLDTPPPSKAKRAPGKAQPKDAQTSVLPRLLTGAIGSERPARPPAKLQAK
jgi:hypothetical protein